MASEPVRDPAMDHLLTPKNSALIIIDNSRCRWLAQLIPCLCLFHLKAEPWNRWAQPSPLGRLHGVTGTFVMGLSELWRRGWESNPRARFCQATRFRGGLFRPLRHLSAVQVYELSKRRMAPQPSGLRAL